MAKRIPAGMLRHRVAIQSNTTALDSFGHQVATSSGWTTDANVRAHIESLEGREAELAQQVYPNATRRVTIEYLSTLDTTGATRKRLLLGSRPLFIGHVNNPEFENWHLELLCGEER